MPSTSMETGRHIGPGEDQQSYKELDNHRDEEQAWEVDEADDIDGKLGDDQENPGDKLQKGAPGKQSPDQLEKLDIYK